MNPTPLKKSFSLIEVLVFISVLLIFFIMAVGVTSVALRNLTVNEHKILATRYAEELKDWLKGEREKDWQVFFSKISATEYCFNGDLSSSGQLPLSSLAPGACGVYNGITGKTPQIFMRSATLSQSSPILQGVDVYISVKWQELGRDYEVPIKTQFNPWE